MVCGNRWELAIPPCGVNAAHEIWGLGPGSSCPHATFPLPQELGGVKTHGNHFPRDCPMGTIG